MTIENLKHSIKNELAIDGDEVIAVIEQLEKERDELAAHCEDLTVLAHSTLWCAFSWSDHNHDYETLWTHQKEAAEKIGITSFDEASRFLARTPEQSLTKHDIEVLEKAASRLIPWNESGTTCRDQLLDMAGMLRQQSKEGEW